MKRYGFYDRAVGIVFDHDAKKKTGKDYWRTTEEFTFYIGDSEYDDYVTIPKDFLTDGASVPRFLWSLIPPWGTYGQAAIVHDYLCDHGRMTAKGDGSDVYITRRQADEIFYIAMKTSGTPVFKRSIIYLGVSLFTTIKAILP